LRKNDLVVPFLAGLGTGMAAAFLLSNSSGKENRTNMLRAADSVGEALKKGAGELGDAAGNILRNGKSVLADERNKGSETLSDLKNQVKEKLDDAAGGAKKVAGGITDISKELAHSTGKTLEAGGKHLQDA
jgi:gas vesicle protein